MSEVERAEPSIEAQNKIAADAFMQTLMNTHGVSDRAILNGLVTVLYATLFLIYGSDTKAFNNGMNLIAKHLKAKFRKANSNAK